MSNSHLFLSLQTIIIKVNSSTIRTTMTPVTVAPIITNRRSSLPLLFCRVSIKKLKTNLVGHYCLPGKEDVMDDGVTLIGTGVNRSVGVGEDLILVVIVVCIDNEVVMLPIGGLVKLLPISVVTTLLILGLLLLVEPDKKIDRLLFQHTYILTILP